MSSDPKWDPENLSDHHEKRVREDEDCIKIYPPDSPDPPVDKEEYRNLSRKAVSEAWIEGNFFHSEESEYRCFFADNDLVLAITNEKKRRYITCFHVHLWSQFRSDCKMTMEWTEGDCEQVLNRWIEKMKKDERWLDVEKHRREE